MSRKNNYHISRFSDCAPAGFKYDYPYKVEYISDKGIIIIRLNKEINQGIIIWSDGKFTGFSVSTLLNDPIGFDIGDDDLKEYLYNLLLNTGYSISTKE